MRTTIKTNIRVKAGSNTFANESNIIVNTDDDGVCIRMGKCYDVTMDAADAESFANHLAAIVLCPAGYSNHLTDLDGADVYLSRMSKSVSLIFVDDDEKTTFSITASAAAALAKALG